MGNIGNFSVVRDDWSHDALRNGIDVDVPNHIDLDKRSVLSFMLSVLVEGSVGFSLRINGTKVWNATFLNTNRWGQFQEVIAAGVVRPGINTVSFEYDGSSDGRFDFSGVKFSDIVIWWRGDI